MLTITKEFHFSASHVLDVLPAWHQCARMHGHNYVVVLELSARPEDLNEAGFVRDYRDLDAFKKWMDDTLDHRHLNEAMGGGYLPIGREPGHVDLRPLDRPPARTDGRPGVGDPEDLGDLQTVDPVRTGTPDGRTRCRRAHPGPRRRTGDPARKARTSSTAWP